MRKVICFMLFLALLSGNICNATEPQKTEPKPSTENVSASVSKLPENTSKIVGVLQANALYLNGEAGGTISVCYVLLENDDVIIIIPQEEWLVNNLHLPYTKEQARAIILVQQGEELAVTC